MLALLHCGSVKCASCLVVARVWYDLERRRGADLKKSEDCLSDNTNPSNIIHSGCSWLLFIIYVIFLRFSWTKLEEYVLLGLLSHATHPASA